MSKAKIFDTTKYRNNPKLIAKCLNDAPAADDPAITTRAIAHLARAHGMRAIAEEVTRLSRKFGDVPDDLSAL
jgi:DNA-binding phage protein